ncbi:Uncharacterized protein involved in propionate catabolism [Archaeoglobus sulfaticallidus PM70-1]|uniref:Uncharacterized protein involved in propionate catabolism n=1 Tax=Archaeoglobus sulfaticallidus PM70-1 TaxID=387631 RepID=N0BL07_9EURY|nr:MmgE/PrpD family protein [Archaeoglobus sulfaticallidus]AGK60895.1 Uncharacterized protein involved in propionate catabolism [Archaeoglobus sulfaticallidus PM70-1]
MTNITEQLINHIIDLKHLNSDVVERCKLLFLDLIGIPFRAEKEESSRALIRSIDIDRIKGDSIAIPYGFRTVPEYSALIMGTLSHSLDFDDTHRESSIHPGAVIIPSILSYSNDLDGKKFIEAMVCGYDIACKLGMALNPEKHYARGFHGTATCGVFGGVAAISRIFDLDFDRIKSAFGVALSMVSGSMQFLENGAWNKRLHAGLASRNAVMAIELAKSGFIGAEKPIEGKYGFLNSYSENADPEKAVDGLGERFEVMHTGVKLYPCCRYIHPALDIALNLEIDPESVDRIAVRMVTAGYRIVGEPIGRKRDPRNAVDAQFSLPYALATALVRKRFTVDDLSRESIMDSRVREVMKKIDVQADGELDVEYPEKWAVVLEIDGEEYRKDYPRGDPEDPADFSEVENKVRTLMNGRAEEIIGFVKKLEKRNMGELFEILF